MAKPTEFQQKILKQEAPGGAPASINAVVPSITKPGESFVLKVAVLDADGYPCLECEGQVSVAQPDGDFVPTGLCFARGEPAAGSVANPALHAEGLFRLQVRVGGLTAHSNPTFCTAADIPGIYWGDPHVHTVLSNCHPDRCRSMNFCFTCGRLVTGLDWVAAADHVSNGRCDFSKWKEQTTVSNLYNDEPEFVTLPAYEASLKGGAGGDNNVYMARFPAMFVDEFEEGTVKTLARELEKSLAPNEFFIVPHHTTRTGKHGEIPDAIYPGPQAMPVVEIHSKWGTSEYRGNPNPLAKIHPGPSYVADLLSRGLKLGFVGGTDTHATMPSGGGREAEHFKGLPGMTAVRATRLTRRDVFDAIRTRHCYATSGERILLLGTVAGLDFGQERSRGSLDGCPRLDVQVAAKSAIARIDVVRNGETIHSLEPGDWQARIDVTDEAPPAGPLLYYYVRVTCESGAQAWSSPVWIAD